MYRQAFDNGELPHTLNEATVIPKKGRDLEEVGSYISTSSLNTDQKYLTKTLAKKLSTQIRQDLFPKDIRFLMIDNFNRNIQFWRTLPISLLGRINTIKMIFLPQLLYLLQNIPVFITKAFFKCLDSIILSFVWNYKIHRIGKAHLCKPVCKDMWRACLTKFHILLLGRQYSLPCWMIRQCCTVVWRWNKTIYLSPLVQLFCLPYHPVKQITVTTQSFITPYTFGNKLQNSLSSGKYHSFYSQSIICSFLFRWHFSCMERHRNIKCWRFIPGRRVCILPKASAKICPPTAGFL